jgi:hypothetical protein
MGQQNTFWSRIIGTVVSDAYLELEIFSELSTQAKQLVTLQTKCASQIVPSKDLPKNYEDASLRSITCEPGGERTTKSPQNNTARISTPT